jgi:hypothetical protein
MGLHSSKSKGMKTDTKVCPRCNRNFECNNNNILKCACAQVPLSATVRQLIAEQYKDCLCPACLIEFSKISDKVKA